MQKSKWMYAAAGLAAVTMVASAWAGDRVSRSDKTGVVFRIASSEQVTGFQAQKTTDGEIIYLASQNLFTVGDLRDVQTTRVRDTQLVSLTLAPGVSEKLALAAGKTGANQIAMLRGGRVVTVGTIEEIGVNEATLSGLNPGEVTRLSRIRVTKGLTDAAAVVMVVPRSETASAGDTVTVDLYVSNAVDLRTYQFALDVTGGATGAMARDFGEVDVTHAEYVFGTDQVIQAVDEKLGRFGAVLFQGSVDVTGQKYVGSYTYQVSPDASGSFTIAVNPTRVSFLTDAGGVDIPFRTTSATVAVC